MRVISLILLIFFVYPVSSEAGDLLSAKTAGKLTMVAILLTTAFIFKLLVRRDMEETQRIYETLGKPDKSVEFREGFNLWRIDWYGDDVYIFRNGIIYKASSDQKMLRELK
jgi:hypothetical protein